MNQPLRSQSWRLLSWRSLSCFLTLAALALCSDDAAARAGHKPHQGKKTHEAKTHGAKAHQASRTHHRHGAALKKAGHAKDEAARHKPAPSADESVPAADTSSLPPELAAVRNAIDLARKADRKSVV